MSWITPSGGLIWHGRALRYRRLWTPFLQTIDHWLAQWQPPTSALLLLGASAGWSLPSRFLCRFRQIHAIDLDPLAPRLFRFNHAQALTSSGTECTWSHGNFFNNTADVLKTYPDHAILFSNVLGQHALQINHIEQAERDFASLTHLLQGRSWASYHDRISGLADNARSELKPFLLTQRISAEALALRVARQGEWFDHSTTQILPASGDRLLIPWLIRKGRIQWVEAGSIKGTSEKSQLDSITI
jgi:hypothetical protein